MTLQIIDYLGLPAQLQDLFIRSSSFLMRLAKTAWRQFVDSFLISSAIPYPQLGRAPWQITDGFEAEDNLRLDEDHFGNESILNSSTGIIARIIARLSSATFMQLAVILVTLLRFLGRSIRGLMLSSPAKENRKSANDRHRILNLTHRSDTSIHYWILDWSTPAQQFSLLLYSTATLSCCSPAIEEIE